MTYKYKSMITVKETSSEERENEMKELFEKMRPFLEQGLSYIATYQLITGIEHTAFASRRWWKDLLEYGKRQGFDKKYQGGVCRGRTGLLNVVLSRNCNTSSGILWQYFYYDNLGSLRNISNTNLKQLRKVVEEKGMPWKVINTKMASKSYKLNEQIQKKYPKCGKSGVLYVTYQKDKRKDRGYSWAYRHPGKKYCYANTLKELKDRVDEKGWEWIIISYERYNKILLEEVLDE